MVVAPLFAAAARCVVPVFLALATHVIFSQERVHGLSPTIAAAAVCLIAAVGNYAGLCLFRSRCHPRSLHPPNGSAQPLVSSRIVYALA